MPPYSGKLHLKHKRTYSSWAEMRRRCLNPNHRKYHRYGGRGIKISKRWDSFRNFLKDMGERPDGTTLDRYPDNNGNYEPGNCRWATPKQQGSNTSACRKIVVGGKQFQTLKELAESLGIKRLTLHMRLKRGMPLEKALLYKSGRTKKLTG